MSALGINIGNKSSTSYQTTTQKTDNYTYNQQGGSIDLSGFFGNFSYKGSGDISSTNTGAVFSPQSSNTNKQDSSTGADHAGSAGGNLGIGDKALDTIGQTAAAFAGGGSGVGGLLGVFGGSGASYGASPQSSTEGGGINPLYLAIGGVVLMFILLKAKRKK